jgi:hypothetical protein
MPKQYKTIFIALFSSLFLLVVGSFIWVSVKLERTKSEEASDNIVAFFHKQLDLEESNALFLSVALSDNKALKEALEEDDEEAGYLVLIETLEKLKTYTFIKDIRTQIISKDLDIFARSWDNSFAGMPLEGFRVDLQRIRRLRKPKVSIDPGRLLTIKATTPIKDGVQIVGYVEAIKTFDEITTRLRNQGIELLVLMEDRFLDIATLMRDNPTLDHYVVSNKNYNRYMVAALQPYIAKIASNNYFIGGEYLYVIDTMRDSGGERIGYYVLSIPKKQMKKFENRGEKLSFFLQLSKDDLYEVVDSWERAKGPYKSLYDKEMIKLLGSLKPHEREMFEEEAREILQNYTQEELIDVILRQHYQSKKEGKIR